MDLPQVAFEERTRLAGQDLSRGAGQTAVRELENSMAVKHVIFLECVDHTHLTVRVADHRESDGIRGITARKPAATPARISAVAYVALGGF